MGVLPCKLPLIVVVAHKSYIVNRQIGVADSTYVVSDDPVPPGHMTPRMRFANFALKWRIHVAFSHNSATDRDRTIKFGIKYA